ncbi:MAG TPA: lytic murein transglycosylase, partial [Ideonella sp.]|uniref:lytic murein transglycosylase n=1 Tax=Ideonella sp. TaxID=1929293 RepID=UPI002E34D66F
MQAPVSSLAHHLRRAAAMLVFVLLSSCTSTPLPPPEAPVASPVSTDSAAIGTTANPTDEALWQRFAQWVASLRDAARTAGIGEATLRDALDNVRYLPRVVELDRAQPEFTRAVWEYIDVVVTPQRITSGQEKLQQVRTEADAAAARYGVPPSIMVAIWGIESNFGSHYGDIPTIDALATLGFEGRREKWAQTELMAALKILQNGDIDRAQMIGSWAGAMGQTQVLPSNFLAYAVDADGDGRRDIWGSMADVLASTANFL